MKVYLDALQRIMDNGVDRNDRTGTGTRSLFTEQLRFNLQDGFPAVTTKRLAWKAMASELLWFIEGSSDERRLCEILHGTRDKDKRTIWTDNAEADYWTGGKFEGDLGRVYGVQWRDWTTYPKEGSFGDVKSVDQLADVIQRIKDKPWDRRHIITAWNPGELDQMALPPCHMTFQFYVADNKLSCHMFQRSCDMFLGVPFNIASYALLTHMIAQVTNLDVGELVLTLGDAHIYNDHFDQVKEQLTREPYTLPTLWLNPDIKNIDDFTMGDMRLENYQCHETIKAPMAI